ncbi:MAG TPA: YDG domain-containing protein, partial [Candidatus Dormibacteraeota bacterium]|nr:YDG domain-containing protein [Candidatus Dormibacteraeota bacterium]
ATTAATVTLATDKLADDTVTPAYAAASFGDKNVGTGKPVSVSGISISGPDAGNYNLTNAIAGTLANITQRDLHVGAAGVNKIYDGTTAATVTLSTDKVPSDSVSASYTIASFADRNVGTNKAVSVAGLAIALTDAANYNLTNTSATTTANITSRLIAIKADDKTKLLASADPPLTYTVMSGMLAAGDSWAGALTRDSGETVGSHAIKQGTLTVTDGNSGNNYAIGFTGGTFQILYAGSGTCAGDAGHVVLQPINIDGTSVFKQGSTVPAKFRVCDANGKSIGDPGVVQSFVATYMAGASTGVNEAIVSTTPDTAFRWDASGQQWIFNVSTKNLSANRTYIYVITLNDGSTITFRFGLK